MQEKKKCYLVISFIFLLKFFKEKFNLAIICEYVKIVLEKYMIFLFYNLVGSDYNEKEFETD